MTAWSAPDPARRQGGSTGPVHPPRAVRRYVTDLAGSAPLAPAHRIDMRSVAEWFAEP